MPLCYKRGMNDPTSAPPSGAPVQSLFKTGFRNPVFCALDTPDLERALDVAHRVAPHVGGLKLGLEFFCAQGPAGVQAVAALGLPLFLDLKLHDIPNTVAGAVRSLAPLGVALLTVHVQGGVAMGAAAAQAARETGHPPPRLIGVTVMTSLDREDLVAQGIADDPAAQVERLARLAEMAGLDGIVCSPQELDAMRARFPGPFTLVVPGLRPAGSALGDQKRVRTPEDAAASGGDVLVVGRPITGAPDPAAAAAAIAAAVEAAAP